MALTDILPTIQDPRVVNQQATADYLRGLPTPGQRLNQEMGVINAPQFSQGGAGVGPAGAAGYQIQTPTPGAPLSTSYTAAPIQTPAAISPAAARPLHVTDKAGTEAAWQNLSDKYQAQDVALARANAPTTPITATLPTFPDTIAGRIARQSNALEQRQAARQTELGIKQQEAGTQAENVHGENAFRAMQGRTIGAGHLAEIHKANLADEYLNPATPEDRRERIAHILNIIKPENTEAEKDVMGLFTGRVLNKSTGEIRGGPAKPTPAEGSRHVDAQGNIAIWQGGKYVPVAK